MKLHSNELLRSKLRSIPPGKFFCEPFIPAASCEVFWFKNKKILLLTFLISLALSLFSLSFLLESKNFSKKGDLAQNGEEVLGSSRYQYPQIYISGGDQGSSSGGLIALASTDEPAVVIGGYNISGDADITMYEADENALLDYLTHDKEGKQTKKNPEVSKFRYITNVKHAINTSSYQGSKVPLPLEQTGIWYLKVKIGNTQADAYVLRSNIGILTKEGDNELIFWGQNFKTKKSITEGALKVWNLEEGRKELQSASFNSEGIAKAPIDAEADIALITQNNDRAIVPLNLRYLNTGYYSYKQFQTKNRLIRYFIFTDRPLYKPGDTVYFKTVLRDDDDVRYTIPTGDASIKIYSGYDDKNTLLEKSFPISADGTIAGEYQLPANTKVGYYTLSINIPTKRSKTNAWDQEWSSNSISFDVEYFKKPEFSMDITAPKTETIAGDKTSFKISGTYFSGQPLIGQKVKYTVYSSDYYEYQYLQDLRSYQQVLSNDYWYRAWYGSNKVTEGTAALDQRGELEINLDTKMTFNKGKSQIFSIEATLKDNSQTPSFSRKNILVHAGEYGIYRKDAFYGTKISTPLNLPVTLSPYRNNTNVGGVNLTAKIHRTEWVPYQDPNQKYLSYRKIEEDLPQLSAQTDREGNAAFSFTPPKIGSYTINVEGQDKRGNLISKIFYSYVSAEGQPYYKENGDNEITISTDQQKYLPTDTVKLNIFSQTPDRDVFLSLERGRVNTFKVIHINGKNGSLDIPLENTDIPNIFAKVSSFSSSTLDSDQTNILVSPDSKKVVVNITPNSKTFGPGENATVNITTTDIGGNPLSADLALWSVDKAIFELSDNKLGDIFQTFWKERYNSTQEAHSLEGILVRTAEMGGCFGAGTKILMADRTQKNIEEVKIGEYILTRSSKTDSNLVKAKVQDTHTITEGGILIINGGLKVTANHIIWVNNGWKEAGSIQTGDTLTDNQGKKVIVSSIEWQRGKTSVYNLEIEKYHTFFANNIWVHNEKGLDRSAFKDTAYWNPSIHTDSNGRAQVTFKLPDNLTTWTLAAVASTQDTKVGQTTSEIVVTKDVIVRPILPNILRTGDELIVSALVQNFTQNGHQFDLGLKFDSGSVEKAAQRNIQIKSNEIKQIYWKIKPTKESTKAKLIFSALDTSNSKLGDVVTQEIPVKAFGFEEKNAQAVEGNSTFTVKLTPDINKEKSKVTLALSPTIIGTLPTAMKYLIDYPFGCVEQTTSRFIPAVIAKINKDMFSDALEGKNIDDIIQKGISRLSTQQQRDGGWTWWYHGYSDPFITSYVVEYLLKAKQAGIEVDSYMLDEATRYLENEKSQSSDATVARAYGLTLLGDKSKVSKITDFITFSPDLLALTVMTNYLQGDTNPQSNGLAELISRARPQGDTLFWEAGNKVNFGSTDASTALAIRAILLADGDRNIAAKGVRYLTRTRHSNYWSNTYATAQVVRALVEFSKTGEELSPNYTYAVFVDDKQVSQGTVSDSKQSIKEISIPIKSIKSEGSSIKVTKNGEGQIYSTLMVSEFHTDKKAKAANKGLSVKRDYVNEKGSDYSIGVGETVIVRITVGGLPASENYAVINDELPSGLVPINETLKNEQYGYDRNAYISSYDITDREVTENGMTLSLYQIAAGERTYTYRARVVSEGTFIIPPVTASLMYAPEISGRSDVQTIKISQKSEFIGKRDVKETAKQFLGQRESIIAAVVIAVLAIIGVFILRRKSITPPENPS